MKRKLDYLSNQAGKLNSAQEKHIENLFPTQSLKKASIENKEDEKFSYIKDQLEITFNNLKQIKFEELTHKSQNKNGVMKMKICFLSSKELLNNIMEKIKTIKLPIFNIIKGNNTKPYDRIDRFISSFQNKLIWNKELCMLFGRLYNPHFSLNDKIQIPKDNSGNPIHYGLLSYQRFIYNEDKSYTYLGNFIKNDDMVNYKFSIDNKKNLSLDIFFPCYNYKCNLSFILNAVARTQGRRKIYREKYNIVKIGRLAFIENGRERNEKGDIYIGEFKDNLKNGKGRMLYHNQEIYDGEWINGLRNGQGYFKSSNGWSYSGAWKDDQQNGQGIMILCNKGKLEGRFQGENLLD